MLQRAARGRPTARARAPHITFTVATLIVLLGFPAGSFRGLTSRRWLELDPCAARFGQTDGDGLLRRTRAMLALSDVVNLLAHELTSLC